MKKQLNILRRGDFKLEDQAQRSRAEFTPQPRQFDLTATPGAKKGTTGKAGRIDFSPSSPAKYTPKVV